MSYKYQLHAHSLPCSKCAKQTTVELIDSLIAGGYRGCVLTNHFLHGNSGIDKTLPWKEFVEVYERDWLQARDYARERDFDLLFGLEEHVGGGLEILCYGVTPQMLYDRPELQECSAKSWHRVLSRLGVVVLQAHPFRMKLYIPEPGLLPDSCIHGIEVHNFGNTPEENRKAALAAAEHPGWVTVSGADTHSTLTSCQGGIECDVRIWDEQTLARVLKSSSCRLIAE